MLNRLLEEARESPILVAVRAQQLAHAANVRGNGAPDVLEQLLLRALLQRLRLHQREAGARRPAAPTQHAAGPVPRFAASGAAP